MNRRRLKGDAKTEGMSAQEAAVDRRQALDTLFCVLLSLIEMMAPFTPFLTELMFQNLRKVLVDGVELPVEEKSKSAKKASSTANSATTTKLESVHYTLLAPVDEKLIDETVERQVSFMQTVVELGRVLRDRRNVPLKYPLPEVVVITNSQQTIADITSLEDFILNELNVRKCTLSMDKQAYGVQFTAEPDIKALGLRLRGESKKVIAAIR